MLFQVISKTGELLILFAELEKISQVHTKYL